MGEETYKRHSRTIEIIWAMFNHKWDSQDVNLLAHCAEDTHFVNLDMPI